MFYRVRPVTWDWYPIQDGYRHKTAKFQRGGRRSRPRFTFCILAGDAHLPAEKRAAKDGSAPWQVLDVQPTESFSSRYQRGAINGLDIVILVLFGMLIALLYMIYYYVKASRGALESST